jgi:hypothetical protein
LNIDVSRTGTDARGPIRLVDDKGLRDGLGKQPIYRGPVSKLLIELIRDRDRANHSTFTAGLAPILEDVFRLLAYPDVEPPHLSLNLFYFAVREEFDIRVLPHRDQLGGKDTGRTVVGREGLVGWAMRPPIPVSASTRCTLWPDSARSTRPEHGDSPPTTEPSHDVLGCAIVDTPFVVVFLWNDGIRSDELFTLATSPVGVNIRAVSQFRSLPVAKALEQIPNGEICQTARRRSLERRNPRFSDGFLLPQE